MSMSPFNQADPPRSPLRTLPTRSTRSTQQVTLGAFLSEWLAGRRSLRPSTRRAYEIHLHRHLIPQLGSIPLRELSRDDLEEFYGELLGAGDSLLSVSTVRRVHATLMSALNHAVQQQLLERNPAALVDLPRPLPSAGQTWSAAQLADFLVCVRGDEMYPLFLLFAYTGLRRGEVVGLRWVDVDLERAQLRVAQQVVVVGAATHVGPPKSANGRRTLAISQQTTSALAAHRDAQRAQRARAGERWTESGLVFTDPAGGPLHPAAVSRRFRQLCAAHRMPPIRLHDLRHTSASLGLASGESIFEVSRRLGHSSIAVTADIYAHLVPAITQQSADRLARFVEHPPQR